MTDPAALKRVDLLGTLGVLMLGVGAGAWFGEVLAKYIVLLLIGGGLLHAFSMYGKHRLESARGMALPPWYGFLYWLCWVLLAMLAVWLGLSRA